MIKCNNIISAVLSKVNLVTGKFDIEKGTIFIKLNQQDQWYYIYHAKRARPAGAQGPIGPHGPAGEGCADSARIHDTSARVGRNNRRR